jgi:hypothetical protein
VGSSHGWSRRDNDTAPAGMTPTGAVRNNQLPLPACQGRSG